MKKIDKIVEDYRKQLILYARDLTRVVVKEKDARRLSDNLRKQLNRYALDFRTVYNELFKSYDELKEAHLETIHRLSVAAEYRDEDTAMHLKRMSNYSALIARRMGLSDKEANLILYASPMHDVGKIGIPDDILFKQGRLTAEEFEIMKTHAEIGARILAGSKAEVIQMAERIAMSHHEKWNGSGYPNGLKGEDIPLVGRITAIADVFDALTTRRPYKPAFPNEKAYSIIREEKGSHFDPHVVEVFFRNLGEIVAIQQRFQEEE